MILLSIQEKIIKDKSFEKEEIKDEKKPLK
jgi:hypothetical protein